MNLVKKFVYQQHGPVQQVLKLVEMPSAALNAGQVRVKWLASPINPADINQVEGTYPIKPSALPAVGGNEGVGQIIETNSHAETIDKFKVGDLVIPASPGLGTWQQQNVYDMTDLHKISHMDNIETACQLMVNPPTAYRLLRDYRGHNDIIIQNGGNSAVGQLVIQMARLMGLRCISVIRDRPDYATLERQLLDLGSTMVIKADRLPLPDTIAHIHRCLGDYPSLAFNCVGGQSASDLARVLSPSGTMVTYGGMSKKPLTISTASLIFKNHTHRGFWLSHWYLNAHKVERDAMMSEIMAWINAGKLIMPAIQKYQLGDTLAFEPGKHKHVFWMTD